MKLKLNGQQAQTLSIGPSRVFDFEITDDAGQPVEDINLISTNSNLTFIMPPKMDRQLALNIVSAMLEWGKTHTGTKEDFGRWLADGERPVQLLKKGDAGIDVSKWQGEIDWQKVVAVGYKFSLIKASEGQTTDPRFFANWQGAKAAGILRGAYTFFRSDVSVDLQAKYFLNLLKDDAGELAPVLDVERDDAGLSNQAFTQAIKKWLDIVEQATGKKPIIYTSHYRWKELTESPSWASQYPLWVAHYTVAPKPLLPTGWTDYYLWQYTDKGNISGIDGNVDLNRVGGA